MTGLTTASPRVLVPVDLTGHGEGAFLHGLAIALQTRGEVHLLHVHGAWERSDWGALPTTRDVLRRWGKVGEHDGPEAMDELGVTVRPHELTSRRIASAVTAQTRARPYDLIVMHTHDRSAVGAWTEGSVSRVIARQTALPTLFLPARAAGLVSAETGAITLRHVLLPLGDPEEASAEVAAAEAFGRMLGVDKARGTLLRVGGPIPPVQLGPDWAWGTRREDGPTARTIAETAGGLDVDLIVLVTRGHDSVGDMLTGSVSERVVDQATCPVLVVPLTS